MNDFNSMRRCKKCKKYFDRSMIDKKLKWCVYCRQDHNSPQGAEGAGKGTEGCHWPYNSEALPASIPMRPHTIRLAPGHEPKRPTLNYRRKDLK